ncbi:ribonuclease H-like domain-containing protein [Melanogaster broomeanus]|nr:ribonuclease H-like domain-containing protein [Melanogaster broomeanus]
MLTLEVSTAFFNRPSSSLVHPHPISSKQKNHANIVKGTPSRPTPDFPIYSWRDRILKSTLLYITNHEHANAQLALLPQGLLGFDLEWKPNFRKGQKENRVALVQLASLDTILLLQISAMSGAPPSLTSNSIIKFPSRLSELLNDPSWIKAGVSIQNDCKKLHNDYKVSVRNCVELSLLARTVDNARWKGKYTAALGLARLLETYETATLAKGKGQRSNWELPLTEQQQEYAANDAHAGYVIYSRLYAMAQAMDPIPLSTYYSFSVINGFLFDHLGVSPWQAQNPFYDPGPPPPPKEPKDPDKTQNQRDPQFPPLQRYPNSVVHNSTDRSSFASSSSRTVMNVVAIAVPSGRYGQRQYDHRAQYHTESGNARERQMNQTRGRGYNQRRWTQSRYPPRTDADGAGS